MKKKVLSIMLSLVMVAGVLTGCGKDTTTTTGNDTPSSVSTESTTEASSATPTTEAQAELDISEPVTLTWMLNGNTVSDDAAVMEKVNAYLKEKLNLTIKPIWETWGSFETNSVLSLQGGDDVDLYFTAAWSTNEYNKFARDGYFVNLSAEGNNLIEKYAKDTWGMLPEILKEGATITGSDGVGVYAIPGWKDYATQNCWDINVPLLEKYGFTLEDIEKAGFYGFGDILKAVKEGEGKDFYPLLVEGAVLERMATNSIIVTGDSGTTNLLSYYIDPVNAEKESSYGKTILNKFATPEYKKFVEKVREYYLAGYIDPAMANKLQANEVRTNTQNEGGYLIGTQSYSRGYEFQASAERGFEVAMVPAAVAYVDTTAAQGAMMAVSTTCKNPERAVMFLNLLNTDPELASLIAFGLEGVHYNKNAEGEIVFVPEARATYQPWTNGIGNSTQLPPLEGQGADFQKEFIAYYAANKPIPILGYAFDQTPVETEMAALSQVAGEYGLALSVGFVDPATELPKFLEKLEANGIQKVVDEANAQLKARFE